MNEDRQNIILDGYDAAVLMAIATSVNTPIDWKEIILNFLFYKKTVIWYQYLNESVRRLVAANFLIFDNGSFNANEELLNQYKSVLKHTNADFTSTEQFLQANPINEELLANTPEKIISVQEFEDAMERFYTFIRMYMPQKLTPRMLSEDMLLIEGTSSDPNYGFSVENPIKVGGFNLVGSQYIRMYLESINGYDNESITYERLGAAKMIESPNGKKGNAIIDKYAVWYKDETEPQHLYFNMYDCELPLKAPMGFTKKIGDKMKIGIVGSRTFLDYELVKKALAEYLSKSDDLVIVSGGAAGADSLGERFADENGLQKIIFKPNWKKYGKIAGVVRNRTIVNESDIIIAFWDGKSRGTKSTISLAKSSNKKVVVYGYG